MKKILINNTWKLFFILIGIMPLICPVIYNELQARAYIFKLMAVAPFALISFAIALIYSSKKEGHLHINRVNILLAMFVAWMATTLLWSHNLYEGLKTLSPWICTLILAIISGQILANNPKRTSFLFKMIILSGLAVALVGVWEHLAGKTIYMAAAPPSSSFGNRNMAGQFILLCFPLAVGGLFYKNSKWHYASLFTVFTMLTYIFVILSRAVILGLLIEVIVLGSLILLSHFRGGVRVSFNLKTMVACLVLSTAGYIVVKTPAKTHDQGVMNLKERINYTMKELKGEGAYGYNERIPSWINTFEMVKDHPIVGTGVGQWRVEFPRYNDLKAKDKLYGNHFVLTRLHNDFLEYWATLGTIGFILLIMPGISCILLAIRLWKTNSSYHVVLLSSMAALFGITIPTTTSFPMQNITPILFMVLIFQMVACMGVKEKILWSKKRRVSPWLSIPVSLLLIAATPSITYSHYRMVKANATYFKGDYLKDKHPMRHNPQMKPIIAKLYRTSYDYDPTDNITLIRHIYYTTVMGHHERAIKIARGGRKLFPYDKILQRAMFEIFMTKKNISGMKEMSSLLMKQHPRYHFSYLAMGHYLWFIGKKSKAVEHYYKGFLMEEGKDMYMPPEPMKALRKYLSYKRDLLNGKLQSSQSR